MRTFIAIQLPEGIKNALTMLQEELKKCGADVKWVAPENIHLTLKFLGERDEKKIARISEILNEVAGGKKSFLARVETVGAFPTLKSPRVIWAGLSIGDKETEEIALELDEEIAKTGIPKEERAFSSHLTLGRVRSGRNLAGLSEWLNQNADYFKNVELKFPVEKIILYKSTLKPSGPVYEPLRAVNLKST